LPLGLSIEVTEITCESPLLDNGAIDLTVTGGRTPYSFLWSTGDTGEDISGLTAGPYSVEVTDDYGCVVTIDTILNVPESLTINKTTSSYHTYGTSCFGASDGWIKVVPTSGIAPFTYVWSGPGGYTATTDSVYGLSEGTYTVVITDKYSCTLTDETILSSAGKISMILDIGESHTGGYNINCNGGSDGRVQVTPVNAAGTPAYIWSDGGTDALRTNLKAGDYEIIITDANGCSADTSLVLTEPDSIKIAFSFTRPYCPESLDGSIGAAVSGGEPGYTYQWNDEFNSPELTGISAGKYTLMVVDANGCPVTNSMIIKPVNNICVGIPNAFSPDDDGINEVWNIFRINLYPEAEVFIMNRWGIVIWKSERGYPNPWNGRDSNGKALPIDSYHYVIDLHNGEKPIVGHITIVRK